MRRAAPLIAEESGLLRKVTKSAISLGSISRSISDVGRFSRMKRRSASPGASPGKMSCTNFSTPSVLVEPGNARALAAALERVMNDRCLADQLVANGVTRSAEFAMDSLAQRYVDLYAALL